MRTRVVRIDPRNIELEKIGKAAQVIKKGGVVAFPTETVYGLGADALNKDAVNKIFELKKRPKDKALTVQIPDINCLEKLAGEVPAFAYQLMGKFWPGPLTLVLKAKEGLPPHLVSGDGATVGVRIPGNKIALALLKESGTALVVPSANLSAEAAANTADEVLQTFDGLIEMVIDGGEVELGVASTVVDVTVSPYKILREGTITKKDIKNV
jgi:L-threonylcarbamoyladenylate synthase